MFVNGFEPVVSSRTALFAQTKSAKRQRKIVEHNENVLHGNFIEVCYCCDRFAAAVHVSGRFHQDGVALGPASLPLLRIVPGKPRIDSESVKNHEADVMACL